MILWVYPADMANPVGQRARKAKWISTMRSTFYFFTPGSWSRQKRIISKYFNWICQNQEDDGRGELWQFEIHLSDRRGYGRHAMCTQEPIRIIVGFSLHQSRTPIKNNNWRTLSFRRKMKSIAFNGGPLCVVWARARACSLELTKSQLLEVLSSIVKCENNKIGEVTDAAVAAVAGHERRHDAPFVSVEKLWLWRFPQYTFVSVELNGKFTPVRAIIYW